MARCQPIPTSTAIDLRRTSGFTIRLEPWLSCCTAIRYTVRARASSKPAAGPGAQTLSLARNSPGAEFVSVDVSAVSIAEAQARLDKARLDPAGLDEGVLSNIRFLEADVLALPFEPETFDHVFVCFLLEHLPSPSEALTALMRVIRPGGTITVIEGDHGLICFHPEDDAARDAIRCQSDLQRAAGGNAFLGRQLYPLLAQAGFRDVTVSPRNIYVDASRPDRAEDFILKTFTAMISGVRDAAIAAGRTNAERFDQGIRALKRTAQPDGVFSYTFFKGVGVKGSSVMMPDREQLSSDDAATSPLA